MPRSTYKVIELIGTSDKSWEEAARVAVERAAEHLRELRVAELVDPPARFARVDAFDVRAFGDDDDAEPPRLHPVLDVVYDLVQRDRLFGNDD